MVTVEISNCSLTATECLKGKPYAIPINVDIKISKAQNFSPKQYYQVGCELKKKEKKKKRKKNTVSSEDFELIVGGTTLFLKRKKNHLDIDLDNSFSQPFK